MLMHNAFLLLLILFSFSIAQCQNHIKSDDLLTKNPEYSLQADDETPITKFYLSQKEFSPKQIVKLLEILPGIQNKKDKENLHRLLSKLVHTKNIHLIFSELNNKKTSYKQRISQSIASIINNDKIQHLFILLKSPVININRLSMLTLSYIEPYILYQNYLASRNTFVKKQILTLYKIISHSPSPVFLDMAYNMYQPNDKLVASYCDWAVESIKIKYPEFTRKYLLSKLNHNSESVYRTSIILLKSYSDKIVIEELIQKLKSVKKENQKRFISKSLTAMINKSNYDIILLHLRIGTSQTKGEMIWILGQIKIKKALPALVGQLENPDPLIRKKVILALLNYDVDYIKDYFVNQLNDPDNEVKNMCILALAHYKINNIPQALIKSATDKNLLTKSLAEKSILNMVNSSNINDLINSKYQTNKSIQLLTLSALSKVKPTSSYKYIQTFLTKNKNNSKMINLALKTLGAIKDYRSAHTLLSYASSKKTNIRVIAIQALGNLGLDSLFLPFVNMLNDQSPEVRRAAALALGKLGKEKAIKHLLNYANDKNTKVRQAVQKAIQMIKTLDEGNQTKKV